MTITKTKVMATWSAYDDANRAIANGIHLSAAELRAQATAAMTFYQSGADKEFINSYIWRYRQTEKVYYRDADIVDPKVSRPSEVAFSWEKCY